MNNKFAIWLGLLIIVNIAGGMTSEVIAFAGIIFFGDNAKPICSILMLFFYFPQFIIVILGISDEISLNFFPRIFNAIAWSLIVLLGIKMVRTLIRRVQKIIRPDPSNIADKSGRS